MADDELSTEELVDALAARVAELRTQVDAIGSQVEGLDELRADVAELQETLNLRSPMFYMAPWWIDRLKRSEAQEAINVLTSWVDETIIPMFDKPLPGQKEDRTGRVVAGRRLKECWFAHPWILQAFASLHWDFKKAHAVGAYETASLSFMLNWTKDVLNECKELQAECNQGCTELAFTNAKGELMKANEISWADRETWIRNYLASRST